MRNTQHATERLMGRLTATERKTVIDAVQTIKPTIDRTESVAVYTMDLGTSRTAPDGSQGRHVVAMIRGGRVATVMLRGDRQPATRTALRVDRVVKMY
jgi:hypothetical protein